MNKYNPHPVLRLIGHQHWLRAGLRYRLIRPFTRAEPFTVDFFGFTYSGNLRNWIDWHVYFFGAYEADLLKLIRDLLHEDSVFMDVGANVGHHSLFASRYAQTVHAFEPYEPVRTAMIEKFHINAVTNVSVHPFALGDVNEVLRFYPPNEDNVGAGSFVYSHDNPPVELPVRKADGVCADLQRLDLVKLDVEGFEPAALRGMAQLLRRFRPKVILEFSSAVHREVQTIAGLTALFPENYELLKITRRRPWAFIERNGYKLSPLTDFAGVTEILAQPR